MNSWHPAVAKDEIVEGENNTAGAVRLLTLKDGGTIKEKLLSFDDAGRTFRYSIVEGVLPVSDYTSTFTVAPAGKNKTSGNLVGPVQAQEPRRASCRERERQDGRRHHRRGLQGGTRQSQEDRRSEVSGGGSPESNSDAVRVGFASRPRQRRLRRRAADADAGAVPGNPATAQELQQIIVIGNAPLPGLGLPLNQIPAECADRRQRRTCSVSRRSISRIISTTTSAASMSAQSADNPFQLDINYHGFTASPLLGTPEGLSVYVDGVRVNESFGDTVNWDLIPRIGDLDRDAACRARTRCSASIPWAGRSSVQTKSGHDNPGTRARGLRRILRAALLRGGDRRGGRQFRLFPHRQLFRRDRLARPVADAGSIRASARWAGKTTRPTST